jgi:hypothetical protein
MSLITSLKNKKIVPVNVIDDITVELPDGKQTKVHVVRYLRSRVKPRLVVFDKSTPLLAWCNEHQVDNAISGGFSLHHKDNLLGEIWTSGNKHNSIPFTKPWHDERGSLHITHHGHMKIAPRSYLPSEPSGDLLQAGPLLVHKGQSVILPDVDPEGISSSSDQFDDDWTGERRFPRAAIGGNEDYIYCVTTDGYSPPEEISKNAGLTLAEMAEVMLSLGATEALNLDGGSSATLVANRKLINNPRAGKSDHYKFFKQGREIPNAIIFEPLSDKFSFIQKVPGTAQKRKERAKTN